MERKNILKSTSDALQSKSRRIKEKSNSRLPRKVKQPSKATIKRRTWEVFSKFIRIRDCLNSTGCPDWGLCITCGT